MATSSLGSLTLDLIAKTAGFQEGMDKADRIASSRAKSIERSAKDIEKAIGTSLKAAGVAAAAAFTALGAAMKHSQSEMLDIVNASKQLGVAIKPFSGLVAIAGDAAVQFTDVTGALNALSRQMVTAQAGSETMAGLFKSLGVDVTKYHNVLDLFFALSDAMKGYADDANKVGVANLLMGGAGSKLIPVMDQGSAAMKKMIDHMGDLGEAFGGDTLRKVLATDDAMNEFHHTVDGLLRQLTAEFLPAFVQGTKAITEWMQAWEKNGGLKDVIGIIETVFANLKALAVFVGARLIFMKLATGMLAAAKAGTALKGVMAFMKASLSILGGTIGIAVTGLAAMYAWIYKVESRETQAQQVNKDTANVLATVEDARKKLTAATTASFPSAKEAALHARDAAQAELIAAGAMAIHTAAILDQQQQQLKASQAAGGAPVGSTFGNLKEAREGGLQKNINASRAALKAYQGQIAAVTKQLAGLDAQLAKPPPKTKPMPSIKVPDLRAAQKLKALQDAYTALAEAADKYAQAAGRPDEQAQAQQKFADAVIALTKLKVAYEKAGGSAKTAAALWQMGFEALQKTFSFDMKAPQRELDAYTGSLKDQLDALAAQNDAQAKSIAMGDQAAANFKALADAQAEATKAVTDFVRANQLHPDAMSPDMYAKQLAALKDYWKDRINLTKDGQANELALQSDGMNGMRSAVATFIESQKNNAKLMSDLTNNVITGFGDAFTSFATGAETAKKAFGSFIDNLYAQAIRAVANKAIAALLGAFDVPGSGGAGAGSGGFWSRLGNGFSSMFGSGKKAGGGAVAPWSMQQVNENGPELLSMAGKDYLMMGSKSGNVTPNNRLSVGSNQTINIMVQPTASHRTAAQVATATARRLRLADARA